MLLIAEVTVAGAEDLVLRPGGSKTAGSLVHDIRPRSDEKDPQFMARVVEIVGHEIGAVEIIGKRRAELEATREVDFDAIIEDKKTIEGLAKGRVALR